MTIEEMLKQMRDRRYLLRDPKVWANVIEAARREPVAKVVTTQTGPEIMRLKDCPVGTKLYTLPPDAQAELLSLTEQLAERDAEIERLQAQVDALMLEFCPDEMTPEQVERWGENQKPALAGKEVSHG